jgi:hypothetical protein
MDPVTLSLILGGMGVGSGILGSASQRDANKKQMLVRAAEQEYAPLSGLTPSQAQVQPNNIWGNMIAGAATGVGQAQNFTQQANQDQMQKDMLKMQQDESLAKQNYWNQMASGQPPRDIAMEPKVVAPKQMSQTIYNSPDKNENMWAQIIGNKSTMSRGF